MTSVFSLYLLSLLVLVVPIAAVASTSSSMKVANTPMNEILNKELYINLSPYGEIQVAYAGRGADLRQHDYLTHADGVRIAPVSRIPEILESGKLSVALSF